MGTPETVVKRARPCSSTFTPLGAPIGFSGDFSRAGSSVFSAHCFSDSEGWRFSTTSEMGVSGTNEFLLSAMVLLSTFDHRRRVAKGQAKRATARSVKRFVALLKRRSRATSLRKRVRTEVACNVSGLSRLLARDLPSLRVLPGNVNRVVKVEQKTFSAVKKAEAEDVVVQKRQLRP